MAAAVDPSNNREIASCVTEAAENIRFSKLSVDRPLSAPMTPLADITNQCHNRMGYAASEQAAAVSCAAAQNNVDSVLPRSVVSLSPAAVDAPPSSEDNGGYAAAAPASPRLRAKECMAELGVESHWDDSDEFYMYVYKVMICPKKFSHEWSACPFAHKGERATRRDPRQVHYSATSCPDFKTGTCPKGDLCPYSHGVFEACLHPERYRTQLCNSGANCKRSVCFFAHALPELRTPVCTPAPIPPPAQPTQAPAAPETASQAMEAQKQLIQAILGLMPNDKLVERSAPVAAPAASSSEELLRAQLASCQQALEQLTSMLSGSTTKPISQTVAVAPRQRVLSNAAPGSLLFSSNDPQLYGDNTPEKRMPRFNKMGVSELSPRTPFDISLDSISPPSGPQLSPTIPQIPPHMLSMFPLSTLDDFNPEDHLPSTLRGSIW